MTLKQAQQQAAETGKAVIIHKSMESYRITENSIRKIVSSKRNGKREWIGTDGERYGTRADAILASGWDA